MINSKSFPAALSPIKPGGGTCRVISLINNKGGVGKTTSTLNIGAALASMGFTTLLIDLDPQYNLSTCFGYDGESYPDVGLWLSEDVAVSKVMDEQQPGLFIIPATKYLKSTAKVLLGLKLYNHILKYRITPLLPRFDFILIDCPPALDVLTSNALVASTDYLIPLTAEFLPYKGVSEILKFAELVRIKLNPELNLLGLFLTKYNANIRGRLKEDVKTKLYEGNYGDAMFKTHIRQNAPLAESPALGKTILTHAPTSNGAKDYVTLTHELINRYAKSKN